MVRLNLRNGRMWGKVCNEACPQKTNILDPYLNAFYYCRLKLVEIAKLLNVTPKAVENALKRFDRDSYSYERELRKGQNKIKRKENDKVRKQKEREKEPLYHLVVRRILKDQEVLHILRQALKELIFEKSDKIFNEQIMCLRYIPCLGKIFHPIPQVTSRNVELITPKKVAKIVDYEIRAIRSDLVGVPGPAILEMPEYLNSHNIQSALTCAELAIKTAGYVPSDASVADVRDGRIKIINPAKLEEFKNVCLDESVPVAKKPDPPALCNMSYKEKVRIARIWLAQNKAAEKAATWSTTGGTGKKGKGGGTINTNDRQAFSAKNGQ